MKIESYINSPTQKAVCDLGDLINKLDKDDHVHYGCSWSIREEGIYHICNEQHREWKITPAP